MSDRVALDGRSTHDECTCNQNMCEPFLKHMQALSACFLNHDTCNERANQRTKHGDRATYQTEHFKHIPIILHMTIKSWIV